MKRTLLSRYVLIGSVMLVLGTTSYAAEVTVNAPQNGATVSGTVAFIIAKAGDVSFANFYVDGGWVQSTPRLTYNWNSLAVVDGAHVLSAKAYYSNGSLAGQASVNVTVSNFGEVTISAPGNGQRSPE